MSDATILNERDARRAKGMLEKIKRATSPGATLEAARRGLSPKIIEQHQKAISSLAENLGKAIRQYETAKDGDYQELVENWKGDPGVVLIIARIAKGMSQNSLADLIGMKEQQIQRYEADRYKSISLGNYRKFAAALGVEVRATISDLSIPAFREASSALTYDNANLRPVLKHALAEGWIREAGSYQADEALLLEYIKESLRQLGSPMLLRTGLQPISLDSDLALNAWRARIVEISEEYHLEGEFDQTDISWLSELIYLSKNPENLSQVGKMLSLHGIIFIYEPHFSGLKIDGASLLVNGRPVVAMSLRHDRLDNFWFTLLHELAHIYLHHQMGLSVGFYDDLDAEGEDGVEEEADNFASSVLIPDEKWRISPARISKAPEVIEQFAKNLGINPAIVFGRIRKERQDYKIFHSRVGSGCVRQNLKQG